jgi:hypothetical protein
MNKGGKILPQYQSTGLFTGLINPRQRAASDNSRFVIPQKDLRTANEVEELKRKKEMDDRIKRSMSKNVTIGSGPSQIQQVSRNIADIQRQRQEALQNSQLSQTMGLFTPGGYNPGAGASGAETFVNMAPIIAPITSSLRLGQFGTGQNPYGFNKNKILSSDNALATLGLLGDVASVGSVKMLSQPKTSPVSTIIPFDEQSNFSFLNKLSEEEFGDYVSRLTPKQKNILYGLGPIDIDAATRSKLTAALEAHDNPVIGTRGSITEHNNNWYGIDPQDYLPEDFHIAKPEAWDYVQKNHLNQGDSRNHLLDLFSREGVANSEGQPINSLTKNKLSILNDKNYLKSDLVKNNQISNSEIQAVRQKNIDWLRSKEYLRRRSRATGESDSIIQKDIENIIKKGQSAQIFLTDPWSNTTKGNYRPSAIPEINISNQLLRDEGLGTFMHEDMHNFSQFPTTNNYKNYPKIPAGNWFLRNFHPEAIYLNKPYEQQVRGLKLLDFIEETQGIPRGVELTPENINTLADDIFKGGRYQELFDAKYDDVGDLLNGVKSRNKGKSIRPELLKFLNNVYTPAGITLGAGTVTNNLLDSEPNINKQDGGLTNDYKLGLDLIAYDDQLKEGGSLPVYQQRGQVSNTVYTGNPNDPRIRAYNDSLALYNKWNTKGWRESLNMAPSVNFSDFYKIPYNSKGEHKGQLVGSDYLFGTNWRQIVENSIKNKIKPLGWLYGDLAIPAYKKPVQPVKYRKQELVKEFRPFNQEPEPIQVKQNVYEGSPVYSSIIGSGLPSALVGFRNQQGDTSFIKPEDYERFGVPKYGKEYIESKKKKQGGPIVDPRGQWAHPGQVTRIPSSQITMQQVPYPVYGVGSNGQEQMMYPGQDYQFGNSEFVDEFPMMQVGGEKEPEPYFKTTEDREKYRTRLSKEAKRALTSVDDDSSYLLNTPYHPANSGNDCINGVCGLNIAAGLKYNSPTDKDRYLGNPKFTDAINNNQEDYYAASDNFNVGDHIVFLDYKGLGHHSKLVYGFDQDDKGNKIYKVIHNGGGNQFMKGEYSDEELKNMISRKDINVYRPGKSLDIEKLKVQREAGKDPKVIQAIKEKNDLLNWESGADRKYNYTLRKDSPYYKNPPEGMIEFLNFANSKQKINTLAEKLGVSKDIIHDELLNTFGELGQENKWEDPIIGGNVAPGFLRKLGVKIPIENTIEKIFKPKSWSIGPGQIKFNNIDPELKKKFNITKPKDLYDFEKVIPLMTAINIQNRKWMENKGEDLSNYLIGKPGVNAGELEGGVGRWTPYMYRGNLRNPVDIANEQLKDSGLTGKELENERNRIVRENSYLFDKNSYADKVFKNIDQNLQRTFDDDKYLEDYQDMQPIVIKGKPKKQEGGSLNRTVTCSNCGWSWKLSDGGKDPITCHKCGGQIKMKYGGIKNK